MYSHLWIWNGNNAGKTDTTERINRKIIVQSVYQINFYGAKTALLGEAAALAINWPKKSPLHLCVFIWKRPHSFPPETPSSVLYRLIVPFLLFCHFVHYLLSSHIPCRTPPMAYCCLLEVSRYMFCMRRHFYYYYSLTLCLSDHPTNH